MRHLLNYDPAQQRQIHSVPQFHEDFCLIIVPVDSRITDNPCHQTRSIDRESKLPVASVLPTRH